MAKVLHRPSAKRLDELDSREVAAADVVVIDRNLVVKDRNGRPAPRRVSLEEIRGLRHG